MSIYLVEEKEYCDMNRGNGWNFKERFENERQAMDSYNKLKGQVAENWEGRLTLYRVVKLIS